MGQISLVSHPSKFSHPSAKSSVLIAQSQSDKDGFVRSGNESHELDVVGNAAALDVYKFLSLTLGDGKSVLDHLEQRSEEIQQILKISSMSFEDLREKLLSIKESGETVKTSEKVKQVFFPVDGDYHLLSILTPSGLVFKLKKRIDEMKFSDEAKEARELKRKGQECPSGYDDVIGLTVIGYGGSKPQNISVLNSQNGGKAYLLPSLPPMLKPQNVRKPKKDFFSNSLNPYAFKESFEQLHRVFKNYDNNIKIRQQRDFILLDLICEQVMGQVWLLRSLEPGWSESENYKGLICGHKVWLDSQFEAERLDSEEWCEGIIKDFARWVEFAYSKVLGKKALLVADDLIGLVKKLLRENREVLR